MALVKAALKAQIKAGLLQIQQSNEDATDAFAGMLADAIDTFVKSGTVTTTVAPGIPVATAGSAVAQTGATTGTGTGTGTIS